MAKYSKYVVIHTHILHYPEKTDPSCKFRMWFS